MFKIQGSAGALRSCHVMKVLGRILDRRKRKRVEMEIGEEQQGFRKGRGKTDGMFILRQLVGKRLRCKVRWHWDLWIWRRLTTLSRE